VEKFRHETVLAQQLVNGLALKPGDIAIDCTSGGGGHTGLMLEAVRPGGMVIAIDQDATAIATLKERFSAEEKQQEIRILKCRFSELAELSASLEINGRVAGVAADLGVSSPQLDRGERGFSFMHDGLLDMRMDQESNGQTARDVVNQLPFEELRTIFRDYGDEPKAHFVAEAICRHRESKPIERTLELAALVANAIHYKEKSRKHPATRVFQGLRIYVNRELEELETLLRDGCSVLKPGGRFGVISFHSLEDKLVKARFKDFAKSPDAGIPKGVPFTQEELKKFGQAKAKLIRPFPIVADDVEMSSNPRARSAKLRILEKI
jgi:16S rRNA (cytosine1402-N4)-methyltransferase